MQGKVGHPYLCSWQSNGFADVLGVIKPTQVGLASSWLAGEIDV